MFRNLVLPLLVAFAASMPFVSRAEGASFKVASRPGVLTTLFWEPVAGARATVLLFPGGGGGFGRVENGRATSNNFLVRSSAGFVAHGFNVAIFGRPSDSENLDFEDRVSEAHMEDVRAVLRDIQARSAAPVWIVGTSRGSISAAAMASRIEDPAIAGLVLTSSVVNVSKPGAVQTQDLSSVRVPVLVYHHAKDACAQCRPSDAPAILPQLTNAPIKKLVFVDGGANPTGDGCGAMHWHGFIGMEKQAADDIARWMLDPSN